MDINTIDIEGYEAITRYETGGVGYSVRGGTLLDAVVAKTCDLESALNNHLDPPKPIALQEDQSYLQASELGSYERWYLSKSVHVAKNIVQQWQEERTSRLKQEEGRLGKQQRVNALRALQELFVSLKDRLLQMVCISMQNWPNVARYLIPRTSLCSGETY